MVSPRIHLKELAGEWKGGGTVTLQGQAFPLKARWYNELVAGSYGLRCEARMIGYPGTEEFIEVELIGYDDYEQQFHMSSVCIFGETHDLRGDWQDDQLLVKDDRMSFAIRCISPNQLKVYVVNYGGGPVFEMEFEK
jgi:hypothetical protein